MCKISGIKENFPWNTVDIDLNGRGDGEMGRWGDGKKSKYIIIKNPINYRT
ncbi:hypothetical protein [Okeania sp. SIO2B3]|uniref:hypothetical protein n=1 Tax=Okeania sp. SIO2B3 TaxID=2607784 RepID=UPI0013BF85D3|nr:hypothetical protein [Okeania sp. SIO2B3]NET40682.1 hypothetical protein [Okeania sp. SIO2B3]